MIRKILCKSWIFIGVLMAGQAGAQSFGHRARIDSVVQSGFYAIPVTPALSALMKTDFSDLRITDHTGNPVPFLLGTDISLKDSALYVSLKMVENTVNDSGQTVLVVENNPNEKLDALYLRIKNAAVSRTINLSGSADGKKWYSIIENVNFEKRFIQDHDSFLENISFPLSVYKYYRVIIYNGKNDPLDIISVHKMIQKDHPVINTVIQNPPVSFVRKDSSKITWLTVDNSKKYHISNLVIRVKSPRFYKRQVDVLAGDGLAGSFLISSDSLIHLSLPVFNDSVFRIDIYNEDNAPLVISGISTGQNPEEIVTYLEAGKSYQVEMTSATASKPHFDLLNFKDSIPKDIKTIGLSGIVNNSSVESAKDRGLRPFWVWPALTFVLIVLGLFTYRLTKEMSKRP
jgi:hypothetical protein